MFMQQLSTNITITFPEEFVLIKKIELEELKEESLMGMYWSMQDLERKTNKKCEWIKENILYPSKFRKILDVKNEGFVFYPEKRGQTWSFQARLMAKFLDKHFEDIFTN